MLRIKMIFIFTTMIFCHGLAQDINIGIRSIDIPEYPRGDYVPFTNCPRSEVTKLEFRVENRGEEFNKANKGLYGSIQIKRVSDGTVLLQEEAVHGFSGFTPGWMRFRFDPIDLSQAGLYEITIESYLVDLQSYKNDRSLKSIDSDMSDNKVTYLNRVFDPQLLEKDKVHSFDFDDIQTKADLAKQGWNYSYLPDSIRISDKGLNGSSAIEVNLSRSTNKRKLFTPPVAVSKGAEIDLQFKLLDTKSGNNLTEELIASEGFTAMISFQDICSTGVKVTSTYSIPSVRSTADGFFKFPFVLKYNSGGNYRGQIEFYNQSDYDDVILVIDNVVIQPKD